MDPWQSHRPILEHYARKTDGPILELGIGDDSTPLLHEICKDKNRFLISVENDPAWRDKYSHYRCKNHAILYVDDWSKVSIFKDFFFSIVFVDVAPWEERIPLVKLFKQQMNNVEYLILHDSEHFTNNKIIDYNDFKFWKDYHDYPPPTLVASNIYPISPQLT